MEHQEKKTPVLFLIVCLVVILAMIGGTGWFIYRTLNSQETEGDVWGSTKSRDEDEKDFEEDEDEEASEAAKEQAEQGEETEAQLLSSEAPSAAAQIQDTAAAAETTAAGAQNMAADQSRGTFPMYVVNCEEYITLRTGAAFGAPEITKIPLGAEVEYLEADENGFYKVSYEGNTGCALAAYLQHQNPDAPNVYPTMHVVNCEEYITLRGAPTISAAEVAKIPLGGVVSYLNEAENGFYEVIYNGRMGYVLSSYLLSD